MRKLTTLLALSLALGVQAQTHVMTVDVSKPTAQIQPEMYGIFFEDINFGADGGLYAELVKNRSFEFPATFRRLGAFRQCNRAGCKSLFRPQSALRACSQ